MPTLTASDGAPLTPAEQAEATLLSQQPAPAQQPATILPMGRAPGFTDPATGQPAQMTPDEAKQARQAANVVDPLQDMSAQEMAELAHKAPEAFTPLQAFLSRPDLQSNPDVVNRAADAHRLFKDTTGALEGVTPGSVASSVMGFFKGLGKWGLAALDTPLGTLLPDEQLDPQGLAEKRATQQKLAEAATGTSLAATGLANQVGTVLRSLYRQTGEAPREARAAGHPISPSQFLTQDQKVQEFLGDVAHAKQLQEIAAGHAGDPVFHGLAKGGDWETTIANLEKEGYGIRPQEAAAYAAGDPITATAFGKAFGAAAKLGGAVLPAEAIEAGLNAAGNTAAKVVGTAIEKAGTVTNVVGKGLEKAAPIVGTIGGVAKSISEAYAGEFGKAAESFALGPLGGKGVAEVGSLGRKIAPTLQKFGREVASGENVTSATAQGVRDALQATPVAAAELAKGVAADLGMAAAGETPEEKAGVGLGTVFGAAGAAGRFIPHVVSGQIVGPRDWGSDTVVPSNRFFPALDTVHDQAFANAPQGIRRRVNAVRSVLKSIHPNADFIYAPKPAEGEADPLPAQLVAQGIPQETANLWAAQDGLAAHGLADGKTLVLARDIGSAPHEAVGHGLENVLGEGVMRQIDQVVQSDPTYQRNWEAIGGKYASRLGWDGTGDWRDFILDKTGWGANYGKEKSLFESQPTGPHVAGQGDVTYQLAGGDWRTILTPQEKAEAADSYISREIFAENADALFKRTGPGLQQKGLPYKIAKVVAAFTQALGAEPLAGRKSENLDIPLSSDVIAAAQGVGQARQANEPVVAPKLKIAGPGTPLPVTPEQQQQAVDDARQAASAASTTPVAGGTKSPREILGAIAEAIATRQGVKLNYLSAPDEPAAAISTNRKVRRALIEIGRTLPAAARSLWEKTFFPERVLQNKDGSFQVSGWSPEVFAANVHRTAQELNKAGHGALIPYPVDPKTGSLAPDGWRQLYGDVQTAVNNYTGGRTASGEDLVVPQSAIEAGAAKPPVRGAAAPLDQGKADFINAMFGLKLPKTSRISTRELGLPTTIVGEDISRATLPGRVEPPVIPRGSFEGPKAEALGIAGRQLMEVNPWRNRAEATGFDSSNLIEARQNLNVDSIKEVSGAPEQPQFRANTLTLQAGFLPSKDPRAVKLAAVRDEDTGKIYTGPTHIHATLAYLEEKNPGNEDNLFKAAMTNMKGGSKLTDGFLTNDEEFLNRAEALARAEELGQYQRTAPGQRTLESQSFERQQNLQEAGYSKETAAQFTPQEEENRPVWYSQLSRTIDAKMPAAASGEQVAAILRNPQHGVKADELKWSGLDDYLKDRPRVTKQEVQTFLKENAVQVKEVTKGETPEKPSKEEFAQWDDLISGIHSDFRTPEQQALADKITKWTAHNEEAPQTKFSQYQLPGGENYREMLFQMPGPKDTPGVAGQKEQLAALQGQLSKLHQQRSEAREISVSRDNWARGFERGYDATPAQRAAWKKEAAEASQRLSALNDETDSLRSQENQLRSAIPKSNEFTSGHWDEPNVLAHVRFNDRTDSEGNKVKFIEEIQSDWHQKGRKEGYAENRSPEARELDDLLQRITRNGWNSLSSEEKARKHALIRSGVGDSLGGVPDAPFKNSWHEMVFRRMVRAAAEEGADKLAWTTGEQQAERYDLSKHIDDLLWVSHPEKKEGTLIAYKGPNEVIKQPTSSDKIADYIGKDAAEKLLSQSPQEGEKGWQRRQLSGLDLKVGGEGMKGFYDKILVDYANKFGKKFGSRVEQTQLGSMKESMAPTTTDPRQAQRALGNGDDVYGRNAGGNWEEIKGERNPTDYDEFHVSPAASDYAPPDIGAQPTVHSLPITPEMRKSAMEGVAQFMPETRWHGKEREGEREHDWNELSNGLLNPAHRTPYNEGKAPDVSLDELQKEGYKTVDWAETPTFHDHTTRAVFYKNDRGQFPLTEDGVRQASDAANKQEKAIADIAYPDRGGAQFVPSEFSLKPGEVGENPEDAGFGNFWVSPQGKFFSVGDHGEWASARTKFTDEAALREEVKTLFGPGGMNSGRIGRVAEEALKKRGWARISRERETDHPAVFADVRGLTPQQESALGVWRKENPGVEFIARSQFTPAKTTKLTHYTNAEDLETLDPTLHGTGLAGAELARKRDYPELYVPRSYFGTRGYEKEPGLGNVRYRAEVRSGNLYDYSEDPKGLYPSSKELEAAGYAPMDGRAATSLYEKRIQEAGYEGYVNKDLKAVAKFTETPVKKMRLVSNKVQLMPGGDSRAIKAAAIRDPEDGKVYEGPMHFMARQNYIKEHPGFDPMNFFTFEEGFTDNGDNFLSRTQAFERAKEMNQLRGVVGENQQAAEQAYDKLGQLASERTQMAQFKPSRTAPEPEEFQDIRTLPAALAKPNWAVLTATKESLGAGTDEVNKQANENLEKALIADGFNPVPVKGNYKGVDQGQNFLVTGMSPEEAQKWGAQYGQESVLTPDGLLYQNGEVNPSTGKHLIGSEAEKQDFYSQIEGGPAFSMGIDFDKKVPLAEARKPFEVRGPVTAGKVNPTAGRGRQREAGESRSLSLKHVLENPDMEDFAKKVVEKIKTVPGFKNINAKSIPKALTEIADRMAQNIKYLYNRATPENRALWRQWYDLAKKMTQEWGPEYGHHPDVVAAVNARLSPQTDWYNNVTLTRAVLDTFKKNPAFTPADREFLKEKFSVIESDKDRTAALNELAGIKDGQKMSELNDTQAGMLMRSHNETTRSLLTHDHNLKLTGDYTGWGKPFDDLRSVVSILRNPSFENVDRELGNNHKVRSFYNNHVAPESPDWTTVDTHAAAAATLMPYGSKDQQIKDVFGSPKHKGSGYYGTYFLYQHAYEQVAKELGILPRELQSIVWEQMRSSLSPETKRSLKDQEFKPILDIHKKMDAGKLSPEEGRNAIMDVFNPKPAQQDLPIQPLTRTANSATLSPEVIQLLGHLEKTLLHKKAMRAQFAPAEEAPVEGHYVKLTGKTGATGNKTYAEFYGPIVDADKAKSAAGVVQKVESNQGRYSARATVFTGKPEGRTLGWDDYVYQTGLSSKDEYLPWVKPGFETQEPYVGRKVSKQ